MDAGDEEGAEKEKEAGSAEVKDEEGAERGSAEEEVDEDQEGAREQVVVEPGMVAEAVAAAASARAGWNRRQNMISAQKSAISTQQFCADGCPTRLGEPSQHS